MTKNANIPPPPPPPPPNRIQCGTCGFTDNADTYKHTCVMGYIMGALVFLMGSIPLLVIVHKIFELYSST